MQFFAVNHRPGRSCWPAALNPCGAASSRPRGSCWAGPRPPEVTHPASWALEGCTEVSPETSSVRTHEQCSRGAAWASVETVFTFKGHLDGGWGRCPAVYFGALGASSGQMTAGKVHCAFFSFPRLPIVIGEKQLWHLAECEPASCPLVGRAVSCLSARALLTARAKDMRLGEC